MEKGLIKAKNLLEDGGFTCVILRGEAVLTATERGIKPLVDWLDADRDTFRHALAADRVVGKAAALLYVYGGISGLYTRIISRLALTALENAGIHVEYDELVDRIENRTKTGLCPMESRCMDVDDAEAAYLMFSALLKGGS